MVDNHRAKRLNPVMPFRFPAGMRGCREGGISKCSHGYSDVAGKCLRFPIHRRSAYRAEPEWHRTAGVRLASVLGWVAGDGRLLLGIPRLTAEDSSGAKLTLKAVAHW